MTLHTTHGFELNPAMKRLYRGVFPVVLTIFTATGDLHFDGQRRRVGFMIDVGSTGHINSPAFAGALLVREFAGRCEPGDMLITNDPWLSAGHFFDITTLTPICRGDRLIAYIGSTIHHTDIGGYGIGAGARDVHEEGLVDPIAQAV